MSDTRWRRAKRQMEFVILSHTSTSTRVKLPAGLSFSGLDLQTGVACPRQIYRSLFDGRGIIFYDTDTKRNNFIDSVELGKNSHIFLVNGELNIAKDAYNTYLPKYPAEVETRLMSYRNSTFSMNVCLYMPGVTGPVAMVTNNLICVSKDTRKPKSLPKWWRNKYKSLYETTAAPYFKKLVSPTFMVCKGVPVQPYRHIVLRREMDWNGHTNASMYLQYCLDALELHLCSNNIQCEIQTMSLLLKEAQYFHRGESSMGDILAVAFWDDEANSGVICFDITRLGESIYQGRMQFYTRSEVLWTQCKL